MREIIIATGNAGKVAEFREIFSGLGVELTSLADHFDPLPDIVENGATFFENAKIKADWVYGRVGGGAWVLADDSGLEVDALGGAPGVQSARYSGDGATPAGNNEKLLRELAGVPERLRAARFKCALVLKAGDDTYHTAEGACEGRIINTAIGDKGFGYDPLFIPDGFDVTFAQIGSEDKNRISHRGAAMKKLYDELKRAGVNANGIVLRTGKISLRVYYEDTDCGNVVYYANYLRYMERGRTELLRDAGIELAAYHEKGLVFAVVEANVKYRRPARYNDLLEVVTRVKETASASITFYTEIVRDGAVLVSGDVKIACVKTANGAPGRIPAEIAAVLPVAGAG